MPRDVGKCTMPRDEKKTKQHKIDLYKCSTKMKVTHRASVPQTPAIAPRFVEQDFSLRCVHRCLFVPTGPAAAEPPQNTQYSEQHN
jgi:hypothetical protein